MKSCLSLRELEAEAVDTLRVDDKIDVVLKTANIILAAWEICIHNHISFEHIRYAVDNVESANI